MARAFEDVVKKLAEKNQEQNKKIVVPYRDNILTKMLQQIIGGDCFTTILAHLRPG